MIRASCSMSNVSGAIVRYLIVLRSGSNNSTESIFNALTNPVSTLSVALGIECEED